MTILDFILALIIIGLIVFIIYYFFRGSGGKVSLARPMESRVDEYLDRRFEYLMDEYSLVRQPRMRRFRNEKEPELSGQETKVEALKQFEEELGTQLLDMEKRLDALEKELAGD